MQFNALLTKAVPICLTMELSTILDGEGKQNQLQISRTNFNIMLKDPQSSKM